MFILKTVHDIVRIPASLLSIPTLDAVHSEIDQKYPNRVLENIGLVIGRYGDCTHVGNGICVAGDGGSHHKCSFRLIIFRPFVEEVVVGMVASSAPEGIMVSIGFFSDIFIPAYWMLNPSRYEESTGLWVWTPQYDDDDDKNNDNEGEKDDSGRSPANDKSETPHETASETMSADDESGYEMYVGAEIRFKVKSINFTQITNTAKGLQATMTTTSHLPPSSSSRGDSSANESKRPVRQRSSSVGIDDSRDLPPAMHIIGSICEDGLGLVSWWKNNEDQGD